MYHQQDLYTSLLKTPSEQSAMTPLFTARRKAKRPGPSTPREPSPPDSINTNGDEEGPVVVRKPLSGMRTKSKLRTSQVSTPTIQTPKVQSRNGTPEPDSRPSAQSTVPPTIDSDSIVTTHRSHENNITQPQTLTIDIASKFGPTASTSTPSGILNPSQIAERKARRARLAKEHEAALLSNENNSPNSTNNHSNSITKNSDFVSLDAYDSDGEFKPSRLQLSTYQQNDLQSASKEFTRLLPEDENGDFAEGFESFVDPDNEGGPNRLNMSMKINQAQQREEIRNLINRAEGHSIHSGNDSDHSNNDGDSASNSDSDASQTAAYTTAQTAHGTSMSHLTASQRRQLTRDAVRPRPPEKTTAIPTFAAGLARLRELQEQAEAGKRRAEVRVAEIDRRLVEVEGEKGRIQKGLEEVGRELETVGSTGGEEVRGRGLDDIGVV